VKKKLHKLNVNARPEIYIIGISSHENDYRLCWAINNQLGYKFSRSSNLEVYNEKISENQVFSVYSFNEDEYEIKYYLVSNTSQNGFLLPEYRNVDFIFVVQGEVSQKELDGLLARLKKIEIINLAFEISGLSAKSIEKFIFS
jgi:hypothetical protein